MATTSPLRQRLIAHVPDGNIPFQRVAGYARARAA
jgi:hypothetical protein